MSSHVSQVVGGLAVAIGLALFLVMDKPGLSTPQNSAAKELSALQRHFDADVKSRLSFLGDGDARKVPSNSSHHHLTPKDVEEDLEVRSLARSFIKHADDFLKRLLRNVNYDKETLDYGEYPPHPQFPDVSLKHMPKPVAGVPPWEPYMWAPEKVVAVLRRSLQLLEASVGYLWRRMRVGRFRAFFSERAGLSEPDWVISGWEEDDELARQSIAGLNPLEIERVKSLSRVERASKKLAEQYADKIKKLVAKGDLYMLDFERLAGFTSPNIVPSDGVGRYFYPAIALLAPNDDGDLTVFAIQLERDDNARIYTPEDEEHVWLYAKLCVANADAVVHEWLSHLAKTHLTIEPHIVATHNTLRKKGHVLYSFLEPFLRDTLLLNWAARQTLVAYEEGNIDSVDALADTGSSLGCGQALQMIQAWWTTEYDFLTSGFEDDLKRRGFTPGDDPIKGYHYMEDGYLVNNLLREFAEAFVDETYNSNAEIKGDVVLQEWAAETSSPDRAAIPGFPERIDSKKQLAQILHIIMWTASGLHAAVNFPQYDYYGYIPNKPFELLLPIESVTSKEQMMEEALPPTDRAYEAFQVVVSLTAPSPYPLTDLDDLKGYETLYQDFRRRAEDLADSMKKANRKRAISYPYLLPDRVPASIDI